MAQSPDDSEARKAAIRAYKLAEAAEVARGVRLDATSDEVRGFRKRPADVPVQTTPPHNDAPQASFPQSISLNHKLDAPFSTAFRAALGAAAGFTLFRLIATGVLGLILYFVLMSLARQ